jgi:hypothetical protein
VRDAIETHLDAVVHESFRAHPLSDAGLFEEVRDSPLDYAGTNSLQDVLIAATLEDDVVDALTVEQVSEQEARWTGADDYHLGAHRIHRPSSNTNYRIDESETTRQ